MTGTDDEALTVTDEQHKPNRPRGSECGICDTTWPCPTAAAALDTIRCHRQDRDRTARNDAIRHAVALGLPLDDISYAAAVTRERIRQIGQGKPVNPGYPTTPRGDREVSMSLHADIDLTDGQRDQYRPVPGLGPDLDPLLLHPARLFLMAELTATDSYYRFGHLCEMTGVEPRPLAWQVTRLLKAGYVTTRRGARNLLWVRRTDLGHARFEDTLAYLLDLAERGRKEGKDAPTPDDPQQRRVGRCVV